MKYQGKTASKSKAKTKTKKKKDDFLAWYEIPVTHLERAAHFYFTIFGFEFEFVNTGTHTMGFFPAGSGVGGALVLGSGSVPSQLGPLLYLNVGSNLDEALGKVEAAGGQILMGSTLISEEMGHYALVLDSEGNRLAFYSKA